MHGVNCHRACYPVIWWNKAISINVWVQLKRINLNHNIVWVSSRRTSKIWSASKKMRHATSITNAKIKISQHLYIERSIYLRTIERWTYEWVRRAMWRNVQCFKQSHQFIVHFDWKALFVFAGKLACRGVCVCQTHVRQYRSNVLCKRSWNRLSKRKMLNSRWCRTVAWQTILIRLASVIFVRCKCNWELMWAVKWNRNWPRTSSCIFSVLVGFFVLLTAASTFYDYYWTRHGSECWKNSEWIFSIFFQNQISFDFAETTVELYTTFSVYTNLPKIFAISRNKSPDMFECLNGIRVLSAIWVIYGHAFVLSIATPMSNVATLLTVIYNTFSNSIRSIGILITLMAAISIFSG